MSHGGTCFQLVGRRIALSDKAAQAVGLLPAGVRKQTAARIGNGIPDVNTAIPASHRPSGKPTKEKRQTAA
jgi:hypothetical protein